MNLPSISIIIPTLNSSKTLRDCLDSIIMQDYPKDRIELIFADGGSTDNTIDLIKQKLCSMRYALCPNPLKTGEAGKAVGVKKANNEIIALIDSDNILPQKDWLMRMVEPFQDKEIIASEPLKYTYRKSDSYITRYCALLGMNDPVCLWLGNYDRYCALTGKWTEVAHNEDDRGGYLKLKFPDLKILPTIGANGFLVRRALFDKYPIDNYLFDVDILYDYMCKNPCAIAKVKTGIIHLYCNKMSQFMRKQRRRMRDYTYYNKLGLRKYPWNSIQKYKIFKFCLSCVLLIPLLIHLLKGLWRTKDFCWFFHPIACILTLYVYSYNILIGKLVSPSIERRGKWAQ